MCVCACGRVDVWTCVVGYAAGEVLVGCLDDDDDDCFGGGRNGHDVRSRLSLSLSLSLPVFLLRALPYVCRSVYNETPVAYTTTNRVSQMRGKRPTSSGESPSMLKIESFIVIFLAHDDALDPYAQCLRALLPRDTHRSARGCEIDSFSASGCPANSPVAGSFCARPSGRWA